MTDKLSNTHAGRIIATGSVGQVVLDILEAFGEVVVTGDKREETLLPMVEDAIGLIVRGGGRITENLIDAGARLKVIGRTGVGYDNVDIAAATARRIPVVYTPGANARAVAEASIALMLALSKRILFWDHELKSGHWQRDLGSLNRDLDGATLGIIGLGRIGQEVAKLAAPFNMTMLAHDPYADRETAGGLGVRLVELDELLGQAEFICIHAALTDQTRGLIDRQRLGRVKRGAYLINLARGAVIESLDVLHEALENGQLAGVGLDVFAPEPPDVGHPIFARPDCLTGPHVLGITERAMERIFRTMAEDMAAVLSGRRPRFVVNPEVLD